MIMKWKIISTIECGDVNTTATPRSLFLHK